QYGRYSEESLYGFIEKAGLYFKALDFVIDLPQINMKDFAQGYYAPEIEEGPEPQFDKAAELREKYGVELGQVWELGEDRLMCGDASKVEQLNLLLTEDKIVLVVADPPYGVS